MNEFQIKFFFNHRYYVADVKQLNNVYKVAVQDKDLATAYGEIVLLEANGDFAWQNFGTEYYQFAISIANALKAILTTNRYAKGCFELLAHCVDSNSC